MAFPLVRILNDTLPYGAWKTRIQGHRLPPCSRTGTSAARLRVFQAGRETGYSGLFSIGIEASIKAGMAAMMRSRRYLIYLMFNGASREESCN